MLEIPAANLKSEELQKKNRFTRRFFDERSLPGNGDCNGDGNGDGDGDGNGDVVAWCKFWPEFETRFTRIVEHSCQL